MEALGVAQGQARTYSAVSTHNPFQAGERANFKPNSQMQIYFNPGPKGELKLK